MKNENKKGEYYLTDIYGILKKAGKKIVAIQAVGADDVIGVNDRHQLAEVDTIMQDRIHKQLRGGGVTIISGLNTYIEDGAAVGMDTIIYPFTFIGREASIGAECVVGPFAIVPREAIVPEGTTVSRNVTTDAAL